MLALWVGSIFWCVGYDTIYALQDREDDALVGIRSSALRLGAKVKVGVTAFYVLALAFWGLALWLVREDPLAILALLPAAAHLLWQALHARSGRRRQRARALPLEPLCRVAGGGRLLRGG